MEIPSCLAVLLAHSPSTIKKHNLNVFSLADASDVLALSSLLLVVLKSNSVTRSIRSYENDQGQLEILYGDFDRVECRNPGAPTTVGKRIPNRYPLAVCEFQLRRVNAFCVLVKSCVLNPVHTMADGCARGPTDA